MEKLEFPGGSMGMTQDFESLSEEDEKRAEEFDKLVRSLTIDVFNETMDRAMRFLGELEHEKGAQGVVAGIVAWRAATFGTNHLIWRIGAEDKGLPLDRMAKMMQEYRDSFLASLNKWFDNIRKEEAEEKAGKEDAKKEEMGTPQQTLDDVLEGEEKNELGLACEPGQTCHFSPTGPGYTCQCGRYIHNTDPAFDKVEESYQRQ